MEDLHSSATTTRCRVESGDTRGRDAVREAHDFEPRTCRVSVRVPKQEGEDPRPPEAAGRAPAPVRRLDPPRESSPRHVVTATGSSVVNVITVPDFNST